MAPGGGARPLIYFVLGRISSKVANEEVSGFLTYENIYIFFFFFTPPPPPLPLPKK